MVRAAYGGEVVGLLALHEGGDNPLGLGFVDPALDAVIADELEAQDEPGAAGRADGGDQFAHQAGAVFRAAAVFVLPPVGLGGEELVE